MQGEAKVKVIDSNKTTPTDLTWIITEAGPTDLGLHELCALQVQLALGVSLPASSLPPRITGLFHSCMLPRWNVC